MRRSLPTEPQLSQPTQRGWASDQVSAGTYPLGQRGQPPQALTHTFSSAGHMHISICGYELYIPEWLTYGQQDLRTEVRTPRSIYMCSRLAHASVCTCILYVLCTCVLWWTAGRSYKTSCTESAWSSGCGLWRCHTAIWSVAICTLHVHVCCMIWAQQVWRVQVPTTTAGSNTYMYNNVHA